MATADGAVKRAGEGSAHGSVGGRRVAQGVYFGFLAWVAVSGSVQILRETVFTPRVERTAVACREELQRLRGRLADAGLRAPSPAAGELAAVSAFRAALGGESGGAWDRLAFELVDGCPAAESASAYALARLRAAHEALVRVDAIEVNAARLAEQRAREALQPPDPPRGTSGPPIPSAAPSPSASPSAAPSPPPSAAPSPFPSPSPSAAPSPAPFPSPSPVPSPFPTPPLH